VASAAPLNLKTMKVILKKQVGKLKPGEHDFDEATCKRLVDLGYAEKPKAVKQAKPKTKETKEEKFTKETK
jgi:hypothetical protein